MYKPQREGATSFAQLLAAVAAIDPEMRVRFTSPHPKDFSDEVLQARVPPPPPPPRCHPKPTPTNACVPGCALLWFAFGRSECSEAEVTRVVVTFPGEVRGLR